MNLRRYIGIPYKSHSCSFDGVDCYQLARLFNREELGVDLPDYKDLYKDAHKRSEVQGAFDILRRSWAKTDEPRLGDLILFKDRGVVLHCGVYLDAESFLHIRENSLSCIEPLNGTLWNRITEGVIRWS